MVSNQEVTKAICGYLRLLSALYSAKSSMGAHLEAAKNGVVGGGCRCGDERYARLGELSLAFAACDKADMAVLMERYALRSHLAKRAKMVMGHVGRRVLMDVVEAELQPYESCARSLGMKSARQFRGRLEVVRGQVRATMQAMRNRRMRKVA